ncbi:class I ribonucleotide reductase maintenance protein YfaE [Bowmanella sp. JS7-9]|uniref:Class I ribonucleotide reductase maintenance protein YfaE n=1 Tax=Pseudobowmanella zhangzhouensis TaxID=1537679 RepID=A0ABW1XJ99_9ALTE|nr:class I ribonucleotide reductase maintenance protein YfaE [Bowmanella sp. JS7-9]TBX27488.1 hypothetical protein TK45_01760 [Bowmanella sp. JS7-9]
MTQRKTCLIKVVSHGDIEQHPEHTVLQALEAQRLDVHYHCREGFCGACRTRLLSGEVDYVIEPLAYINDDEILPCCCRAVTDIELELA